MVWERGVGRVPLDQENPRMVLIANDIRAPMRITL